MDVTRKYHKNSCVRYHVYSGEAFSLQGVGPPRSKPPPLLTKEIKTSFVWSIQLNSQ